MSTDIERPWRPTELQPSKRKQAPMDELRAALREVWEANPEDFQDKQVSTDNGEAVMGSVAFDKADVARLLSIHIKREHPDWVTASWKPAQINRRIHWAAEDAGVDRNSAIARRREIEAIQAAEPMGDVAEPGLNTQRDAGQSVTEPTADPAES